MTSRQRVLEADAARFDEAADPRELRALKRLNETGSRLWRMRELDRGLGEILALATELLGADLASIHVSRADPSLLELAALRGVGQDAVEADDPLRWENDAGCVAAFRSGESIWLEDSGPDQEPSQLLKLRQKLGARSVTVAPLFDREGMPLGILSVFYTSEESSARSRLPWLGSCARLAADFVERCSFEIELSENAERYRQLVHGLSDTIVWEGDPDIFRLTFVSSAAETLLGYPVERWVSEPRFWVDHIHPDDREGAIAYCSQEAGAGRDHEFEYRMLAADGRVVWLRDRVYVSQSSKGERRFRGVMLDITRRKEAERRLSESEERFRMMSETAPVMIWMSDPEGRCLHVNRMLREFWNVDENKLAEFDWSTMLHPDDAAPVRQQMQVALQAKSSVSIQARFRSAAGEYRVLKTDAQPRFSGSGEFLGLIGINVDVTNEVRAFEALRESEERFAQFMRYLPGLAWIKDADGRYVYANEAATRVLGGPRGSLEDLTDEKLFPPEIAAQFRRNDLIALDHGAGIQFIETLEHEDGVLHHSIVSKFPIPGPAGQKPFIGGVAIDITERKAAEDRVAKLNDDLRRRLEEQEALLRALPVGVFIADDASCSRMSMNPAGAAMLKLPVSANASKTGSDSESLPFRVFRDGVEVAPEDLTMQRAARLRQPVVAEEVEVVFSDGSSSVLYEHASPLFDAAGRVRGCVGVFVDITERKRAEEHQKLLIAELNHRVKNTLAITQSIASLTLRETPDPAVFKAAFSERLRALAQAHSLLTKTSWKGVSLLDLTWAALKPFDTGSRAISTSGPPVTIKPNAAVTLSLVLHELATNAAKHGALSTIQGRVNVTWRKRPGDSNVLELVWRESGGPSVEMPSKAGFGSRLIAASVEQLGGTVDLQFKTEGVEARFCFSPEE